jgi:pyruvate formate lyase activating enzyme
VRTPIIPGATDSAENIAGIGSIISRLGDAVERWELCAFNNLCRDKYARLGLQWQYQNADLMDKDDMDSLLAVARGAFAKPGSVLWTGATRNKEA